MTLAARARLAAARVAAGVNTHSAAPDDISQAKVARAVRTRTADLDTFPPWVEVGDSALWGPSPTEIEFGTFHGHPTAIRRNPSGSISSYAVALQLF
jgi:hypothetical protein